MVAEGLWEAKWGVYFAPEYVREGERAGKAQGMTMTLLMGGPNEIGLKTKSGSSLMRQGRCFSSRALGQGPQNLRRHVQQVS